MRRYRQNFGVRKEKPIHIDFDGEPVPDITMVGRQRYRQQHPAPEDLGLLVEVAVSSEEYDLGEKALLYARAGILEYWVALPEDMSIVVHRDPASDGYQTVTRFESDAQSTPQVAADAVLSVRKLLGIITVQD